MWCGCHALDKKSVKTKLWSKCWECEAKGLSTTWWCGLVTPSWAGAPIRYAESIAVWPRNACSQMERVGSCYTRGSGIIYFGWLQWKNWLSRLESNPYRTVLPLNSTVQNRPAEAANVHILCTSLAHYTWSHTLVRLPDAERRGAHLRSYHRSTWYWILYCSVMYHHFNIIT